MLLERLNENFPGVDFYARTVIAWTDGPTEHEVHAAMGDLVNGDGLFQRTLSPEFQQELIGMIEEQSGAPFKEARLYEGGFRVNGGEKETGRGYGNEQVAMLSEMISR